MINHTSVLRDDVITHLCRDPEGYYVDATFGRGGHSSAILDFLSEKGKLIALDRDPDAITAGKQFADERLRLVHTPFSALSTVLSEAQWMGKVDGILLDLGVSSPQLDTPYRGFSFLNDGPLDMRMDPTQGRSAAEWLAHADREAIYWVIKTWGEERFAGRIANAIVAHRQRKELTSTQQLTQLITAAIPYRDRGKHAATRTFQAIRIHINDELTQLQEVLPQALDALAPGGRLVVLSFHSLEDRVVKEFIKKESLRYRSLPHKFPVTEAQRQQACRLERLGKYRPSAKEIAANPRSRSAILRVAARTLPHQ